MSGKKKLCSFFFFNLESANYAQWKRSQRLKKEMVSHYANNDSIQIRSNLKFQLKWIGALVLACPNLGYTWTLSKYFMQKLCSWVCSADFIITRTGKTQNLRRGTSIDISKCARESNVTIFCEWRALAAIQLISYRIQQLKLMEMSKHISWCNKAILESVYVQNPTQWI